jgi:spore maturation protein CgeB
LRRELAENGLATIRARHTCAHRVKELVSIVARLKSARELEAVV